MGEVQQIAELPSEPKIVPNMKGWESDVRGRFSKRLHFELWDQVFSRWFLKKTHIFFWEWAQQIPSPPLLLHFCLQIWLIVADRISLCPYVNLILHGRPVLDTRMVLEATCDYS